MAFLFKNKKNADKLQGVKEGPGSIGGSQGSQSSSNGRTSTEKGLVQQSPGSSVNNSLNSLPGTGSPDQMNGRGRGPSDQSDLPVSCSSRKFILEAFALRGATPPLYYTLDD